MSRKDQVYDKVIRELNVPKVVSMRQARLALLQYGILDQVQIVINNLEEPTKTAVQIEWDYSQTVERNKPFVELMLPLLGLDDAQSDQLFILAGTL